MVSLPVTVQVDGLTGSAQIVRSDQAVCRASLAKFLITVSYGYAIYAITVTFFLTNLPQSD
jgi:hypothetical protein